jgi:hypothetical protein
VRLCSSSSSNGALTRSRTVVSQVCGVFHSGLT